MDFVYRKFRIGPSVQTVALYANILPEELVEILKATLPIVGDIIGVQDENRTVIPLSLLCKNPFLLSNGVYGIVVSARHLQEPLAAATAPPPARTASPPAPPQPSAPPLAESETIKNNSTQETNHTSAESPSDFRSLSKNALEEILNFISFLRTKEYLSRSEFEALEYLLSMKSSLLPAAYSIAKSAGDTQYFAEICKDIAENMMVASGQSACSAQEDVLQCCDQLYINNQINENQLLYLRHLVLIRDNNIANLYDQFQADRSPENLIRGLCRAASGYNSTSTNGDSSFSPEQRSSSETPSSPLKLHDIIKTLRITPVQGLLLSYLIKEQDRKVIAAVTHFQRSQDMESLRNNLTQIAIEEDQKMREEEADDDDDQDDEDNSLASSDTSSSSTDGGKNNYDAYDENENQYGENDGDNSNNDGEDGDEDEDNQEGITLPQSPVASSRLDALLKSMNETNKWSETVPSRFILAVFAAAQRQLLTPSQASGLCDLFRGGNDLVLSAWEVFTTQGDVIDFIDTLRRIVRFAQQHELQGSNEDDSSADTLPVVIDPPKRKTPTREFDVEATERAREDALEAVTSAKRDLLQHSLELLAKQGLITPDAAMNLLRQSYEESDRKIDEAIEAYAVTKDMMQFLKTLIGLAAIADAGASSTPQQGQSSEDMYVSGALTTIADHLLEESIIPKNVHTNLTKLIKDQNQEMKNAWIKYREQKCELTDVVDVMLRLSLAATEVLPTRPSSSSAASSSSSSQQQQQSQNQSKSQSKPTQTSSPSASVLSSEDYKNIIDIYVRAKTILPEEKTKLYSLIDAKNPSIAKIFTSFEQHRDVHQLLNGLQQVLKENTEPEEEEEVESKFLQIVKKMNLTADETSALREAISNDDPLLRSALELYRSDENENNLMTNLKAISQRIMKTSPARRTPAASAAPAPSAPAASTQSVSPPIQDIFPILLNEFVKHQIFTSENSNTLQRLYQRKDDVLMAALDLYELDHDLAGLVDSLEKILKYV